MADNDVIGWVGFVSAQGIQEYQVFENGMHRSKVTTRNVQQEMPNFDLLVALQSWG